MIVNHTFLPSGVYTPTLPRLHSNTPAHTLLPSRTYIFALRRIHFWGYSVSVQYPVGSCPLTGHYTGDWTLSPDGQRPAVSCSPPRGGGRALRARSGRPSAGRCCGPLKAARLAALARVAAARPQRGLPEGLAGQARPSLAAGGLAMRWRGRGGAARCPAKANKSPSSAFQRLDGPMVPTGP